MQQYASQYSRSANLTVLLAERGFLHRSASPEAKDAVHSVFGGMYCVDHYVDSFDNPKRQQVIKNVLGYLNGKEDLSPEAGMDVRRSLDDWKISLDKIPAARKTEFLDNLVRVFDHGEILASTKKPRQFVDERAKEAVDFANMILGLAGELGDNKKFRRFYHQLAVTGNLEDSFEDARDDWKAGKIAIRPAQLYFSLAKHIVQHAAKTVAAYPDKAEIVSIGMLWTLRHVGLISQVPWVKREDTAGLSRQAGAQSLQNLKS